MKEEYDFSTSTKNPYYKAKSADQAILEADGSIQLPSSVMEAFEVRDGDYMIFRRDAKGITMHKLQKDTAPDQFPSKRFLDEAFCAVMRNGKKEDISFSDLKVDEQLQYLSTLNRKEIEGLCLFLADTIRGLGLSHHLDHSKQYDGSLSGLITELSAMLQRVLGTKLRDVILYGSYARGDYTEESDINFLVLVDEDNETQLRQYRNEISSPVSVLGLQNDIVISIKLMKVSFFHKYCMADPRLKSVNNEGITFYHSEDTK
ncbi:MAG: nucleotidyltransferase domain-containing protein [Clostridia bacterium]|nr:nucleotidyltransferase domain-containing protein [Clostridia bacterium]